MMFFYGRRMMGRFVAFGLGAVYWELQLGTRVFQLRRPTPQWNVLGFSTNCPRWRYWRDEYGGRKGA